VIDDVASVPVFAAVDAGKIASGALDEAPKVVGGEKSLIAKCVHQSTQNGAGGYSRCFVMATNDLFHRTFSLSLEFHGLSQLLIEIEQPSAGLRKPASPLRGKPNVEPRGRGVAARLPGHLN